MMTHKLHNLIYQLQQAPQESIQLLIELKLSPFIVVKLLQLIKSDYGIPYLMNLTKDENSLARYQVPETLRIIDSPKAKQALNKLLTSHSSPRMLCLVIKVLEEIGTDEVIDYLKNAIECPFKEVHLSAIYAIGKIGTSKAISILEQSLFYTEEIKKLAQELLKEIEQKELIKSNNSWKIEEKKQQLRSKILANERWNQVQNKLKKRNTKPHLDILQKAIEDVFLEKKYERDQLNLIYQLGSTRNSSMIPYLWEHLCQYQGEDEFLINLTINTILNLQNQLQDEQFSNKFGLSPQAKAKLNREKQLNPSDFNPPLKEKDIERIEQKLKISLPQDYREFLLEFANGGWINCSKILTLQNSLHRSTSIDSLFIPDLHMNQGYEVGILQIADLGCGHGVGLVLTGPERGTLWSLGDYHIHEPWLNQSDIIKTTYQNPSLDPITTNYSMYRPYRLTFSQWCEEC